MSMTTLDLLLHPVRMRIVNALSGGRSLTTAQLCSRMPEVSQATVYRHVGVLMKGALLELAGERAVGGGVEREYRLRAGMAAVPAEAGRAMTRADHRRAFGTAVAVLLAEFNAYLSRRDADPYADAVGYRQATVWLSEAELRALVREVGEAVLARLPNAATAGRRPYLLSPILFPLDSRQAGDAAGGGSSVPPRRKRSRRR